MYLFRVLGIVIVDANVLGVKALSDTFQHCSLLQTSSSLKGAEFIHEVHRVGAPSVSGKGTFVRGNISLRSELPVQWNQTNDGSSLLQRQSSMGKKSNSTIEESEDELVGLDDNYADDSFWKPWKGSKKWATEKLHHLRQRKKTKLIVLGTLLVLASTAIFCGLCCKSVDDPWDQAEFFEDSGPSAQVDTSTFKIFGREIICEEPCDYVLVLPLRGQRSTNIHQTAGSVSMLHWDAMVDGVKLASDVFLDPSKAKIPDIEETITRRFGQMSFAAYHTEVRKLLSDILVGPKFGLEVATSPSADHDEVFVKLTVPRAEGTLDQFAQNMHYKMPLSDKAYFHLYERTGEARPDDNFLGCRAVAEFKKKGKDWYQPFHKTDCLRILKAQLDKYIDLQELLKQGVLVGHFMPHSYRSVVAMCKVWANPFYWFRVPSHDADDNVRNYFGEEIAWMSVWQTYFTRALFFPCFVGMVGYLRRFIPKPTEPYGYVMGRPVTDLVVKRDIQLGLTVLMMAWCTFFNVFYDRRESRVRQHWGMDREDSFAGLSVRNEYDSALNDTFLVKWVPFIGDVLAFCAVALSIGGVFAIQLWRQDMLANHSHWIWPQAAAFMITMQIFVIDKLWRSISRLIVDCENHRSQEKWNKSWVQKLFVVRIFNNLYPFLYVGFLKQYTHEGCPPTEDGCLGELEMNLLMYFAVRLLAQVASDLFLFLLFRVQVLLELLKRDTAGSTYTYLQVQAKQLPYDAAMKMDDWTEQVLTFTFVASFNVVLPAISVVALLANLLECRMVAHRNTCYLQRPEPQGASGIGAWREILFGIEILAVIINLGFAIFVMRPLRDFDTITKWLIFIVAEHVIVVVKLAVRAKFPPTPSDVEEQAEKNQQIVHRLFIDLETHPVNAKVVHPQAPDIGPGAFGGRDHVNSSIDTSSDLRAGTPP